MERMQKSDSAIRPIRPEDYPQVRAIYEMGLQTGNASWETQGQTWEQFSRKKIMETVFVAVDADDDNKVLGWVGAAKASTRSVFHGVVEDSIYTFGPPDSDLHQLAQVVHPLLDLPRK